MAINVAWVQSVMSQKKTDNKVAFCGAVDWGTTRFRLWVLDHEGSVLVERQSDRGMSTLQSGEYEAELEAALDATDAEPNLPIVICGMAGSAKGWVEAPYADLPARPLELFGAAIRVPSEQRDIRMLPGLAQRDPARPDVMRGEETLLLGLMLDGVTNGLVCMPGTHSKWVQVEDGVVTRFSTIMTGEFYSLLSKQSTLAHAIGDPQAVAWDDPAFGTAVSLALANPAEITRMLFSVRAGPLLGILSPDTLAARLSGLLIGLEIAGMQSLVSLDITLVSQGKLALLYQKALSIAGHTVLAQNSDVSVRRGLFAAAKSFWLEGDAG